MAALLASDSGQSVMEFTAVEIPVNDMLDIRTEKAIQFFKPLLVHLSECLEMVFSAPVVS